MKIKVNEKQRKRKKKIKKLIKIDYLPQDESTAMSSAQNRFIKNASYIEYETQIKIIIIVNLVLWKQIEA